MPIRVECPCGSKLVTRGELVGKGLKCPSCGKRLTVPPPIAPEEKPFLSAAHPPVAGDGRRRRSISKRDVPLVMSSVAVTCLVLAAACVTFKTSIPSAERPLKVAEPTLPRPDLRPFMGFHRSKDGDESFAVSLRTDFAA